jgi:hypothetical protein
VRDVGKQLSPNNWLPVLSLLAGTVQYPATYLAKYELDECQCEYLCTARATNTTTVNTTCSDYSSTEKRQSMRNATYWLFDSSS